MSKAFKFDPQVQRRLLERSDAKGLVQLAGHLALLLLAAIGVHLSLGSLWALLALPFYGGVLIFLFAPLHETVHYTAFESKWLNNLVAAPIGFLLLLPYRYFRAFHYGHHRYTQDPERDPELFEEKPKNVREWAWRVSGLPTWREHIAAIWRHALGNVDDAEGNVDQGFIEQHKHRVIVREARIHAGLYAAVVLLSLMYGSAFIWWYWILPLLLGQPLLRLFLLAEHTGCDLSDDMLENSRTTYTSPFLSFLCWNMCYHAEHHYLAAVPFHALPAMHAYTGPQVKFRGDGYYMVNRAIFTQLE